MKPSSAGEISAMVLSMTYFLADSRWTLSVRRFPLRSQPATIAGESPDQILQGEIGDARAVEPLTNALMDGIWGVREAAAETLGKVKNRRWLEFRRNHREKRRNL